MKSSQLNNRIPKVSVLMPVYNCGKYLVNSIESILCQTYNDFELIVINDGSDDQSLNIISSFDDPRIHLVDNGINLGVVTSLNKGLDCARGEYVARMDADDICLRFRLEKQVLFLEQHPETSVVASRIVVIDNEGDEIGFWDNDLKATISEEIERYLPIRNCIAHPSVMFRKEVVDRYRYRDTGLHAEDYDLWLRMVSDGIKIEKIPEVLLEYRSHKKSVTAISHSVRFGAKDIGAKAKYLYYRLIEKKKFNEFDLRVSSRLAVDICNFWQRFLERNLRNIVRQMLLYAGKAFNLVTPKYPTRLFFFFPAYHTGGSERVHADIIAATAETRSLVVVTEPSRNNHYKSSFLKCGRLLEPTRLLANPVGRILGLGYFSALLNRTDGATVLGANTSFYYELIPLLADHVNRIDLLHAFGSGLENVSLPICDKLDRRVVINRKTLSDLERQYTAHEIEEKYFKRVLLIENATDVPLYFKKKQHQGSLKVLYVGRNSAEKRVHLVAELAKVCKERQLPVDFTLIGDVSDSLPDEYGDYCTVLGLVDNVAELEGHYREHDLLIVTSSSEGFPLVIMEAMAQGVVPVSTDVGGISAHVVNGDTGYLVSSDQSDEKIVASFGSLIAHLVQERGLLEKMSLRVYQYARDHFSYDRFFLAYQQLLMR